LLSVAVAIGGKRSTPTRFVAISGKWSKLTRLFEFDLTIESKKKGQVSGGKSGSVKVEVDGGSETVAGAAIVVRC
jgi:hypothetical protein